MDKLSHTQYGMKLFIHSQTSTVEVWEWISNPIPHFIMVQIMLCLSILPDPIPAVASSGLKARSSEGQFGVPATSH